MATCWGNMKIPALRVIFDRSAFHETGYQQLLNSRLKDLCRRGRIRVFHTPTFLAETLDAYGSARQSAADWQNHLQFALAICNGGIFLEKEEIWHEELVAGHGTFARHLLPERPNKNYDSRPRLMARLRELVRTGDLEHEWSETEAIRIDNWQKKRNQRRILLDAREEVARIRKEQRITEPLADYSFAEFCDSTFVHTGKELMDLLCARRAAGLADQWAQRPARFPFYTEFIKGFLYAGYHAMVEVNDRIDVNAQADFEQLAYLTWADIVVSNDQRFFRQAFEAIWEPRGKRLETSESFAALVDRLAS